LKLKAIGHGLKIWAPLRKPFASPGVPSWLQACVHHMPVARFYGL